MKKVAAAVIMCISIFITDKSFAHCEVPCGIYDDEMRVHMLQEHITTMEKAIKKIKELSGNTDPQSKNQLIRWVINKEKHAEEFQHIVWQYFLTQRIKPVDPKNHDKYHKYLKKVEILHQLSFYAMKVKQNVDTKYTEKLRELLLKFENVYFGKQHMEKHHKHHH
ncbi:superoxide dismutase [Ni] [Persephonella sp.]